MANGDLLVVQSTNAGAVQEYARLTTKLYKNFGKISTSVE